MLRMESAIASHFPDYGDVLCRRDIETCATEFILNNRIEFLVQLLFRSSERIEVFAQDSAV